MGFEAVRRQRGKRKRVLILGGGLAGLGAARALRCDRHEVTLVDRGRCFEFLPNVHELLSGVKTPDLLRLPLDRNLRRAGHKFVRDTVTRIDPVERTVRHVVERADRASRRLLWPSVSSPGALLRQGRLVVLPFDQDP